MSSASVVSAILTPHSIAVDGCDDFFRFHLTDVGDSGLGEEEMAASLATLQSIAETICADCIFLRQKKFDKKCVKEYLVRKQADEQDFMEVR